MKNLFMFALTLHLAAISFGSVCMAEGSSVRGGGDQCENRVKIIRDDLRDWIDQGGHKGLVLPPGLTMTQYFGIMLREISLAKIRCVGPNDRGHPVSVDGTPKVCRFDRHRLDVTRITCDSNKFQSLNESDQYVLIHHEYAGLAGLEEPTRDGSSYVISNQISGHLTDVIVKKLAIKPITPRQSAKRDDFILCRYTGANYPAVKIDTKDLEPGKCPIRLPSRLSDFQFRISRHLNSSLLRVVIENKKTDFWMRSLGGADEIDVSLGLSDAEGRDVANQVGLIHAKIDELRVSCRPSFGLDSDSYLLVSAPDDCNQ